jgi:hypothetical protein
MKRSAHLLSALLVTSLTLGCFSGDGDEAPGGEGVPSGTSQATDPPAGDGDGDGGQPAAAAPPAEGSPFEGRFVGDDPKHDLALELAGTNQALRGSMRFRGDTYPVKASVSPDGVLEGSFETKGRGYGIRATCEGDSMELTSSDKTYALTRQGREDLLASWVGAGKPTPGLSGLWIGEHDGRPAALDVTETDGRIAGTFACGGRRYVVSASRTAVSATGVVEDPASGARYTLEVFPGEGSVTVWLSSAGPLKQIALELERAE